MLPLFDEPPSIDRGFLARRLQELAAQRVYFGVSSWKYEGWLGSIYTPERYFSRGRFSKKRFDETCLQEYAEVFPIVCGDFSFYNFPSAAFWHNLFTTSPAHLRFAFKVPEALTVRLYPQHARYGASAGQVNESFLDSRLMDAAFVELLRPYQLRIAVLILEFGTFPRQAFVAPEEFVERLDLFLSALPKSFRYAVEIRNFELFDTPYFTCLRKHGVAHVFNAWTRMPDLPAQISTEEAFTASFTVSRALLRQGRTYDESFQLFAPYERVQEENPGARAALRELVRRAREREDDAFLFVNNRLEGNAPGTIQGVVEGVEEDDKAAPG